MGKNKEKRSSLTLSEHFKLCFGILLISLSIIALTGKTAVGEFFAYCFAYLFGSFFPAFAAAFLLLGVVLVIRKKFLPVRNHSFLYLGVFLILLSMLSLGSISFMKENASLNFSNFTEFYAKKMKSFALYPFSVDSYEAMSTLGGGYFGLALLTLFSSVWGLTGNMVFFIAILLLGIFFALFSPISTIAKSIHKKKAEKVAYNSPFHPEKGKEKKVLDRGEPVIEENKRENDYSNIDPELKKPLSNDWQRTTSFKSSSVLEATLTQSFSKNDVKEAMKEETVKPVETPVEKPVERPIERPVVQQEVRREEKPVIRENESTFRNNAPIMMEKSVLSTPDFHAFDLDEEAENFRKGAKGKDRSTFDVIDPIVPDEKMKSEETEKKPVYQNPTPSPVDSAPSYQEVKKEEPVKTAYSTPYSSYNPLEAVAKNVQPRAKKEETVQVTFPVEEEEEEEEIVVNKPVKKDDEPAILQTEEEATREIEKRYFLDKQKRAIQRIEEKQRLRNERKANLMRFVSDTPKVYHYPLPTDALLQEHDDSQKMQINTESAIKKVQVINEVFKNYQVKAKAVSFTVGASVTRFNIETEPGERSDRIASLVDELQKALNGDKSVRVETVVEGKSTSGIEVGNAKPMAVSFKDVFESVETNTHDNLLLPIGKDISGDIVTSPLNKMPHLLIAGTTGSGKSVLVHSMIMTLIMRNYPSQMKLILIDPKQVEFIRYQECSHLFCPVISQPEKAVLALKLLVDEMNRRFTVFSNYKAANIESYNKARQGREAVMEEMPYLVCVIDEFADLMMTGGKDVVNNVQKIGQKARAAGIHMIIATQRPSKDTVPMMIKANVPCRIGLSCSAQVDSRVILDENGAETLLGRGDLLFKDPGKKSLVRAQSPFLSDEEIDSVLAYVKEKAGDPVYNQAFLELEDDDDEEIQSDDVDPQKKLYDDVKDFVIHTGIMSKESIMRNFQVSSSKADNFLATMVSEQVLMFSYDGNYVFGPAAISARQKEGL